MPVDFLSMVRLEIAATDQLHKEVAYGAGPTAPDLTRVFHGEIPLTPGLKARLILGLHKETMAGAPDVVRTFAAALVVCQR